MSSSSESESSSDDNAPLVIQLPAKYAMSPDKRSPATPQPAPAPIPKSAKSLSKAGKSSSSTPSKLATPKRGPTPKTTPKKSPLRNTRSPSLRSPTQRSTPKRIDSASPAHGALVKSIIGSRPTPRSYNTRDNDDFVPAMFPITRVRSFIKENEKVNSSSPEAVALIACATDKFIDFFVEQTYRLSEAGPSKNEISYDKAALVVKEDSAMHFLTNLVPQRVKYGQIKAAIEK
eukprot:m.262085 g.262085  ORF g.262085 m.262085 type:complete len:232 (-) comp44360_c0_seq1:39-734(-)